VPCIRRSCPEQGQRLLARRQDVRVEAALSEEILNNTLQRVSSSTTSIRGASPTDFPSVNATAKDWPV
jgi:hypothetical protein